MSETRTQIDLHTEQYDAGQRPVDIKGDVYSITFAIEKISQSLEGFSDRSDKKADVESEGEIRYVFNRDVLRTIVGHSDLLKEFNVQNETTNDGQDIKEVGQDEQVVLFRGKIKDMLSYVSELFNILYQENQYFDQEPLRVLIPNQFTKRFIGAKGSNIQRIAQKSLGSQIKILSDREDEARQKYVVVNINGSLQSKQEANR